MMDTVAGFDALESLKAAGGYTAFFAGATIV